MFNCVFWNICNGRRLSKLFNLCLFLSSFWTIKYVYSNGILSQALDLADGYKVDGMHCHVLDVANRTVNEDICYNQIRNTA